MELSTSESATGLTGIILVCAFFLSIWALVIMTSDAVGAYMDQRESLKQEEMRQKQRGRVTPRELDPHHIHGYQVRL